VSSVQRHPVRPRRATPLRVGQAAAPALVVCIACGVAETPDAARLAAWQHASDGSAAHCRDCAELLLDDVVLVWAECGHASEDGAVLYDRPVCVICEAG
jgi:hypothetical protein